MNRNFSYPQDWETNLLDAITKRGSGHTPSQKHPEYWNGGVKWVSLADSSKLDNRYIQNTDKEISALGIKKSSAVLHPKDTVILSRDAGVGKSALLGQEMAVSQHFIAWICETTNKSLQSEYLYYWLQWMKPEFERMAVGSTVKTIGLPYFKKLNISYPKLPEQTAIASMLSTWDLAIEKAERLIAVKERSYLWLSQKHLFGDAVSTANASKKTKWFSVPNHWKIVKIGKIAKEVGSFNNSGENIPVLSCTKYDGLVDSLTYFNKQVFSQDTSTYKVVAKGQFAYATNHIEEGSIGYQDVYDKGLVSPMYTVFETNKDVDDSYLYKVLKSVVYLHIFRANTSSSVDRRGSLRWKEFAKLPIPLPPIEEQKQIAVILTTARQEIDLLKKQADAYRRQKRGLMQRLLTGDWRVRVG